MTELADLSLTGAAITAFVLAALITHHQLQRLLYRGQHRRPHGDPP